MYHKKNNTGARDKLKTFPRMLLEEYECECVEKLDDLVNLEFIYLKQINDKKKRERMEAILIAAGTSTLAGAAAVAAFVFKKWGNVRTKYFDVYASMFRENFPFLCYKHFCLPHFETWDFFEE